MLKVAIVGCGSIFTMHATSCANLDGAELVAVCDIKKDRADAAAAKYGVKAYYDYKEMIDTEHPDVLHVCVRIICIPLSRNMPWSEGSTCFARSR